jgi:hypothetical protein
LRPVFILNETICLLLPAGVFHLAHCALPRNIPMCIRRHHKVRRRQFDTFPRAIAARQWSGAWFWPAKVLNTM